MEAEVNVIVRSHVSKYGQQLIYDKQLLKYMGYNEYCRIKRKSPDLWADFPECWDNYEHPTDVEAHLLDSNLSATEIKRRLIIAMMLRYKSADPAEINQYITSMGIQCLINPDSLPDHYNPKEDPLAVFAWIIVIFFIMVVSIFTLYLFGFAEYFFAPDRGIIPQIIKS